MQIVKVDETERAEFLSLVNAEIRPDRAKTTAWEDFPLMLGVENSDFQLVCRTPDGRLAGCIACLIRDYKTTCGIVPVAGVGSVVTHPDFRGKGLSSALQNEMLRLIKGKNVPLAVLWTDQPEIYSGRGFKIAGWEIHAQLEELRVLEPSNKPFRIRDFRESDSPAIEKLYGQHPLGTVRRPGDSKILYSMPGTVGLVAATEDDQVLAAVFCGKGADFPDYITEWDGPHDLVINLMAAARDRGLASKALLPPGEEGMVNALVDRGGSWFSLASGYWNLLNPDLLADVVARSGNPVPAKIDDPAAWLGCVDDEGQPLVGPLTVAVWGFDSV